jgi:nucleoside-diphosphate-sugar epimerase
MMAAENEVWCAARFSNPDTKAELEAKGIRTFEWTMGESSLSGLDDDFTHVVHAAVYRGQPEPQGQARSLGEVPHSRVKSYQAISFDTAAQVNSVGAGMVMHHCRRAQAFLHISTFGVYAKAPTPEHPVAETDPLGGYTPYAPSYGIGKLAAEGAVRAFASVLDLPTTIARLNLCYGPTGWGGLPVDFFARVLAGEPIWIPPGDNPHPGSPISTDDVTAFVPGLWDVASPKSTVVNLAGDEAVSVLEFMTYIGEQTGREVVFVEDDRAVGSILSDNTRRRELVGDCRVHWRDGMMRALEAHYPDAFRATASP